MSKLTRKFIISLSLILISVVLCSLYLNIHFIERYFLYQEKQDMNNICDKLINNRKTILDIIYNIESTEDVLIVCVEKSEDNALLNQRLRKAFLDKGIGLNKYWLWEQDQQDTIRDGRKMRIYSQNKFHYSLMVEYLLLDNNFLAVVKIVPSIEQMLYIVNRISIIIFVGALIIMFILISILIHKITVPLKKIGETAKSISLLNFKTVEINTNDELEILAEDINNMSKSLKKAHKELENKNKQMEELLANVSHDLKTPVALIKAYTSGIKDNIDDGTFLNIIIEQNNRIEQIIERLLNLAKIQQVEYYMESVNISDCLNNLIQKYQLQAEKCNLTFLCTIENFIVVTANLEIVQLIFTNFLSNAVKYAAGECIEVFLCKLENYVQFQIRNKITNKDNIDIKRLWEPFYVAEKSRNKNMSGTGLGLSIVKAAADKYNIFCDCHLNDDFITFIVRF